jgi:alpha-2-macroglobulin
MKGRKFLSCVGFFSILGAAVLLNSCSKQKAAGNYIDPAVVEEISPFRIGRLSPVIVRFTQTPVCIPEEGLVLSPVQNGTWSFRDERTAVFTPGVSYKPGSRITLSVNCAKLFGKEYEGKNFKHTFIIDEPSYKVNFDGLSINGQGNGFELRGTLVSDIPLDEKDVQKVIRVKLGGKTFRKRLPVLWDHAEKTAVRRFSVNGIEKYSDDRILSVTWSGTSLGLSRRQDKVLCGKKTYRIPSSDMFSIMDIDTSKPDIISVSFSEPVDTTQDLLSFFTTKKRTGSDAVKIGYSVHKNIVNLYNEDNWQNVSGLNITKGIKSTSGRYLAVQKTISLDYNWDLPSVRFSTGGTILPSSQGTILPIETRNLAGVSVQVYEIYNSNIVQFLQVNDLDGQEELYRVAEPVWTKNIPFEWNDSMQNRYIPRGLDLTELVKKFPDGMFQIRITFRHENVKYVCRSGHRDFSSLRMPPDFIDSTSPKEKSWWDYWDNMSYNEQEDYWDYRDDPCHPAFYTERYNDSNFIKRNVLVSDIGIMAKKTGEGDVYVTVTDIKTAQPVSGADVSSYSFVGKLLKTAKSDVNGSVVLKNAENVSFIAAGNRSQVSYLKLSEGTGLSVSHFEIGGEKAQNGVKGFIYGERGVWRPGDPVYLTFVVQDSNKILPAAIPVVFELQDPLGRITDTRVLKSGVNGFYAIGTKTAADAPTGLWTARAKIGGQEWTKSIRVETVVPNHLSVKLETPGKYLSSSHNRFTLTGAWLHGAAAPDYKADVSVRLLQSVTNFDGYSEYTFTDPERSVETARETVWEGKLDKSSRADFTVDMPSAGELPGKLKAQFITRLFEPSGAFSTEQKIFDYSPYSRYIGLKLPKGDASRGMLLTDTTHTADVVLLSEDGKPAGDATLSYKIYKLEWKWWWEKDALTGAAYVSSDSYDRIAEGSVAVKDGKGSFTFMVKYPDWGRYMVVVSDGTYGHSAAKIVYIDWPGWAGRAQESSSGSASMVPLVCDKRDYIVGQTAQVSFASSAGERALVTIEKGGSIVHQEWLQTADGTTVFKLPLTAEMAPNVYVHVTLLQPHMQTANSLPVRLYGIVPVIVSNPAAQLDPVIDMPSMYAPNKPASLTVWERRSRPMTFTVAVVDEGLLGLTSFKAPCLYDEFYKKEASQLQSWDIFRYVMNAYSGKLETLLAVGGSEEGADNNTRTTMRFTPVVKYFGPYEIKAGGKQDIEFDMPQYIGAVRVMVVAGNNGAYGTAEKSVPVKSNLMVQPSIPRTLGTNETVYIPLTVFNGTGSVQQVTVKFNASGACKASEVRTLSIPSGDNSVVSFLLATADAGKTLLNFQAEGASASAGNTTLVDIVSRGVPVTYRDRFVITPGAEYKAQVQTPGEAGSAQVAVEISTFPAMDINSRLKYLITYPHGCIEQITSGGFPQLYVPDFIKLSPKETDSVKRNVQSVIERYPQYQTSSGGFSYWAGNSEPSAWGSCYGAHFLLEAEKAGYKIPDTIIDPLIAWISASASNWVSSGDDDTGVQAYKLFVLAKASAPNIGAMNRLMEEKLSISGKLLLAAAYAESGRPQIAKDLFAGANGLTSTKRNTDVATDSPMRDTAMNLYVSNMIGDTRSSAKLSKSISDNLASGSWYSTQETAWALMSVLPYYKGQTAGTCSYKITNAVGSETGEAAAATVIERLTPEPGSRQNAVIANTGSKVIYGTLSASGMSKPGTEQKENETINLTVTYYDMDGRVLVPADLKTGDSFRMQVVVSNNSSGKIENIALTVPVPTCWEFSNDRVGSTDDSGEERNSPYTNQDIRDEAVYTYFDLPSGGTFDYTFYGTVAYSGEYYVPAVHAEAMYDNAVRAMIPGIYVKPRGNR